MIAIYNDAEYLVLNNISTDTDWGAIVPRMSRISTLDGGAVLSLFGQTDADRTMKIIALDVLEADALTLRDITLEVGLLYLSCPDGLFEGAISRYVNMLGRVEIEFLIKSRIV